MKEVSEKSDVELVGIINSFNRLDLLKKSMPSLVAALKESLKNWAVVIYDAGSKDGSREWLGEFIATNEHSRFTCLNPGQNEDNSFSAGINAACAAALKQHSNLQWLFLFETDNWIANSTPLKQAFALMEKRPELGAVGFTVSRHDGSAPGYASSFPTLSGFVIGPQLSDRWHWDARRRGTTESQWQKTGGVEWSYADVVFISPILITREAWMKSGGLDSVRFPFSECDMDWAWRLRKLGFRQGVIRTTGVVHDNLHTLSEWSATRVIRFHQARLQLLRLHFGNAVDWIKPFLLLRHCVEWLGLLIAGRSRRDWRGSLTKRAQLIRTVMSNYQ